MARTKKEEKVEETTQEIMESEETVVEETVETPAEAEETVVAESEAQPEEPQAEETNDNSAKAEEKRADVPQDKNVVYLRGMIRAICSYDHHTPAAQRRYSWHRTCRCHLGIQHPCSGPDL